MAQQVRLVLLERLRQLTDSVYSIQEEPQPSCFQTYFLYFIRNISYILLYLQELLLSLPPDHIMCLGFYGSKSGRGLEFGSGIRLDEQVHLFLLAMYL